MPQASAPVLSSPPMFGASVLDEDSALVDLAKQGDHAACSDLFGKHWVIARRVAFRLLGNEQDAEDATQTGMVKAIEHLAEFDGRSQFRTWLLRIVTNTALDDGRRRSRRQGRSVDWQENSEFEPKEEPDPGAGLHREDLRKALDHALSKLSPTLRATFILHADGGLSYKEVADCQQIAIGTVMSRIHEARKRLQTLLQSFLD